MDAPELSGLDEKAKKTGASKIYVEDLQEEFVRDFVYPMFRAGAVYEGSYLLGTSIARPLIGKRMVEIAVAEGADAVSHGATGKGNDQVRFELTAYALKPDIRVIAPWREWTLNSRESLIAYAQKHGAHPARWSFLTGDYASLKDTIVNGFKISMGRENADEQDVLAIFHGTHFVLVDAQGQLRGYYDSDDAEATTRLVRDAERLARGEP